MAVLYWLVSLANLVLFIMVLIKQFKTAGVVHGIIGIITCGIWTFIWGWMNAGKLGIQKLMLAWTVTFILTIVLGFATGAMGAYAGLGPTPVTP
ncbi:MAG TPA: hypothetical protein VF570_15480 [Pyrinomonadaceae bacterium]